MFSSENIQYVYNFHETDLYVNACRGAFRGEHPQWSFFAKIQKSFIADVLLGWKYVSGISFMVEKVYRMSPFV